MQTAGSRAQAYTPVRQASERVEGHTEAKLPCAPFLREKQPFLVAAAAENDEGNNNDPAAVVIAAEKPTDTVVIHNSSSL